MMDKSWLYCMYEVQLDNVRFVHSWRALTTRATSHHNREWNVVVAQLGLVRSVDRETGRQINRWIFKFIINHHFLQLPGCASARLDWSRNHVQVYKTFFPENLSYPERYRDSSRRQHQQHRANNILHPTIIVPAVAGPRDRPLRWNGQCRENRIFLRWISSFENDMDIRGSELVI